MGIRILLLLVGGQLYSSAFADACHVTQSAANAQVPAVVIESCYEFTGVAEGTVDWSCGNESNQPQGSEKHKVANCKSGSVATCSAALTQESLANHRSTGENEEALAINVPSDAKVITYFYSLGNHQQAKVDCEHAGGTWTES